MSALLKEILDMVALPCKWEDSERATFLADDLKYGIAIEYLMLDVSNKHLTVANVSFGRLKNKTFQNADDLDTSITNFGKPRTILSTVAEACINNEDVIKSDLICLAAADQAKEKRLNIYSLALSEIRSKVKEFSAAADIYVKSKNGTQIIILSKAEFSEDEQREISEKLEINKL